MVDRARQVIDLSVRNFSGTTATLERASASLFTLRINTDAAMARRRKLIDIGGHGGSIVNHDLRLRTDGDTSKDIYHVGSEEI